MKSPAEILVELDAPFAVATGHRGRIQEALEHLGASLDEVPADGARHNR